MIFVSKGFSAGAGEESYQKSCDPMKSKRFAVDRMKLHF